MKRVGIGPDEPYYDPTAWANVIEQRCGNTGRNEFRGLILTLNMSCSGRSAERPARLQFRVEG